MAARSVETVANADSERGHNAGTASQVYLDEETLRYAVKPDGLKAPVHHILLGGLRSERHEPLNDKPPRTGASR